LPDLRIIIISTTGTSADEIEHVGMSKDDDNVLQKPFHFSKLLGLIKPEKVKANQQLLYDRTFML
jgi:hypothetical protein